MPTVAETARLLQARAAGRGVQARAAQRTGWRGPRSPFLFLMSDETRLPDPVAALARLPRGAAVILRHYGTKDRAALARRLVRAAKPRGILVLVAGDWRLAARSGAAGLHLPQWALKAPLAVGPAVRSKKLFVTMSVHSFNSLFLSKKYGVSAVLVSPVFPTDSHPSKPALGHLRLAALCRQSPVPVIALGGLDARSALKIRGSGAAGIAGIGGIAAPSGAKRARKVLA